MNGVRPPLLEEPASAFFILFVQGILLLCLFFALLFSVAELTMFSLMLLILGFGTYAWSRASLNRFSCHIALSRKRLFPGERLNVDVSVTNSKILPLLFKVDFFAPRAITGSDRGQWISEEAGLLWFQQVRFSREFFPDRRGVFDLGPPRLRGGDLFGFFFKTGVSEEQLEVVVYPRIPAIRPIAVPQREFYGIPGAKSPVEDPVYVFGTRDYQPGRPARRIHWKASARHHRLQEKLCEPAAREKLMILLDVEGFENETAKEAFEKTLEVIAAVLLQMERRGVAVGFATNGRLVGGGTRIVPISRSPLQMGSILEALARVQAEKTDSLTEILSTGYPMPWGVSAVHFSWKKSERTRSADVFMRQRKIPVRCIVSKPPEKAGDERDPNASNILFLEDVLIRQSREK